MILNNENPFFLIMPEQFLMFGIAIATIAAVIASQAMISGSFTLISEAVRLNIWPKVKINYPSIQKGQLYVPSVNFILWVGCMIVVLLFKESKNMEAAYGLAINITFLMTTILMTYYLRKMKLPRYLVGTFLVVYLIIELSLLVSNGVKIVHGGWLTIILASILLL